MVTGSPSPLVAKPELLDVGGVTVPFDPVAGRLPDAVPLRPAKTVPSAIGAGLAVSCPAVVELAPETAMVRVGLEPSDVAVTLPLAFPADSGANFTLNVALCPAVSVAGVEIPLKLNPVPLMSPLEIVTRDPPVWF